MRLQTKIFVILIPIIIIPITFIGWIAYKRLLSISQETLQHQMISSITAAENEIKEKIESMEKSVILYGQTEQIDNFVLTNDNDQRYALMLPPLLRHFRSYQKIFDDCIEMRILTNEGYEDARLTKIRLQNQTEYEHESSYYKEISNSPETTLTTFFKNPDNNKYNMIIAHKLILLNNSLNPVTEKPELKGYLIVTCSLDRLQAHTQDLKFGKKGHLFYTNKNGEILFHKDKSKIGSKLSNEYFMDIKHIATDLKNNAPVRPKTTNVYINGKMIHPELFIFAELPKVEYDTAGKKRWAIIVFGTIIITLLIIFAAILSIIKIQILTPLQKLNFAIEKIGEGDLNFKFETSRADEIGELSYQFNSMSEKLQKITFSHDYVDAVLESMTDSVFVISPQGIIKKANAGACDLTGYLKDQLISSSILKILTGKNQDLLKIIKKGQRIKNNEITITTKNRDKVPVLFSTSSMIHTKDLNDIVCVLHNISDRIKIEQEKISAQKTAAEQSKQALIGRVAGKMAHDFNNVLSIIMGNSELALDDCNDINIKQTLDLILSQTIRGKNLTKNLIAFAKSNEPKLEYFDINEKIEFVVNLLKKDLIGVELKTNYQRRNEQIVADPGMIEHALVNLLQNSIHAISRIEKPIIFISSYASGECLFLEVKDNGCGIPGDHIESIFEPSFTLKGSRDITASYTGEIKGSGYGLSNVKKNIEQHKGTILVESAIGAGSKFIIRMPIIRETLSPEEITETLSDNIHSNKSILIVEDEIFISNVQSAMLSQGPFNHSVDIAPNGKVAIELFESKNYDVVSLDYILPGKIDGMDVYNHIRKTNKIVKILFISGNLEFLESLQELRLIDDNINHLSKPCQNKEYIEAINKLIDNIS